MQQKIRVLIVDDHPIVRKGLRQIVRGTRDITVAGEAVDGREGIRKLRAESFDVVLLDISLPDQSGLEVLREMRERPAQAGSPSFLMLSMLPEEEYGIRSLRAGAAGYVTKDSVSDELIGAIRKAAHGGRYLSPALAEALAGRLDREAQDAPHKALSERELQVMTGLGLGRTAAEIAEELSLSVKTISTYRTRMLEKMGMCNNAEVMRYAIKNGLA